MFKDLHASAIALYDGGWRAKDGKQLAEEHTLTKDEADQLRDALKRIEDKLQHQELKED